ncbi:MAG: class I SAM-dependent methyltransferase [Cyanobacteria bacterium P01_H01_bin.121]
MTDTFYQFLQSVYSRDLSERKVWYAGVAAAYAQTRPRYPIAFLERVADLAQLPANACVLEIGCGPATATVDLAKLGYTLHSLEPAPDTFAIAQQICADYPNVTLYNTSFEEWSLESEGAESKPELLRFDAVIAANSWHWLTPTIAEPKAAQLLKPGGRLILLWNTVPQLDASVFQRLELIYQTLAPNLGGYETPEQRAARLKTFEDRIQASDSFNLIATTSWRSQRQYTAPDYVGLLSTLSPYIALEPEPRQQLLTALQAALEQVPQSLETGYTSIAQIARLSGR